MSVPTLKRPNLSARASKFPRQLTRTVGQQSPADTAPHIHSHSKHRHSPSSSTHALSDDDENKDPDRTLVPHDREPAAAFGQLKYQQQKQLHWKAQQTAGDVFGEFGRIPQKVERRLKMMSPHFPATLVQPEAGKDVEMREAGEESASDGDGDGDEKEESVEEDENEPIETTMMTEGDITKLFTEGDDDQTLVAAEQEEDEDSQLVEKFRLTSTQRGIVEVNSARESMARFAKKYARIHGATGVQQARDLKACLETIISTTSSALTPMLARSEDLYDVFVTFAEQHKTLTKRYRMDLEAIEEEKSRFREELERLKSQIPLAKKEVMDEIDGSIASFNKQAADLASNKEVDRQINKAIQTLFAGAG